MQFTTAGINFINDETWCITSDNAFQRHASIYGRFDSPALEIWLYGHLSENFQVRREVETMTEALILMKDFLDGRPC